MTGAKYPQRGQETAVASEADRTLPPNRNLPSSSYY